MPHNAPFQPIFLHIGQAKISENLIILLTNLCECRYFRRSEKWARPAERAARSLGPASPYPALPGDLRAHREPRNTFGATRTQPTMRREHRVGHVWFRPKPSRSEALMGRGRTGHAVDPLC